jgi:hypothetical protein
VEAIVGIQLSQYGARLRVGPATDPLDGDGSNADATAPGELDLEWGDLATVVFARLETTRKRNEMVREDHSPIRGARLSTFRNVASDDVQSRPILEVHARDTGGRLRRLRLDEPTAGMYDYLGRRREYTHAYNLGLVVKDIVRFGPAIRASHGVHALLSERRSPGMSFGEAKLLEDYLVWFTAMGSARVRDQWMKIRGAMKK